MPGANNYGGSDSWDDYDNGNTMATGKSSKSEIRQGVPGAARVAQPGQGGYTPIGTLASGKSSGDIVQRHHNARIKQTTDYIVGRGGT